MLLALDFALIIEKLVLILIVVMSSLGIAMYTTFAERKVAAILQDRRGPNRAGPFGLFQPLAEGLKLFFKEEINIFAPSVSMSCFLDLYFLISIFDIFSIFFSIYFKSLRYSV